MIVLVDTSIWVHHLRYGNARLAGLLDGGEVLCHPFVIGELACGRMRARREILGLLAALPRAQVADHEGLLHRVERHRLWGRGLGWVDIHLPGPSCALWTADRALREAARALGIAANVEQAC